MVFSPSSSIYSRSTGSLELQLVPITQPAKPRGFNIPDRPEIREIDHVIGDSLGFSTALEASPIRLQSAKKQGRLSQRELKDFSEKELMSLQWENEFFEVCTETWRKLATNIRNISQDMESECHARLLDMYLSPQSAQFDNSFLGEKIESIDTALKNSHLREKEAAREWKAHWGPSREITSWI